MGARKKKLPYSIGRVGTKRQRNAYQFFRENGMNVSQAKNYVKAEEWAWENDYTFNWEQDDTDSSEWSDDPEPWAQYRVAMYDADGNFVTGLGGVDFGKGNDPWGHPYKRITEAEIALEVMG